MADYFTPEARRRRLVKVSAVKTVSSKLSTADQGSLQWFFGRGQVAFERSTMGGMLERANTFNLHAIRERNKANGGESIDPHGPITARPTAEVRAPSGHVPDDNVLTQYARVSRRLLAVERAWPTGAVVLERFFGDTGARWADSDEKRLFALYPLTRAGQKLLKADAKAHPDRVEMRDDERIGVLSALEKMPTQSKRTRRLLLMSCEKQAVALLAEAGRLWNQVKVSQ